MGRAEDQNRKIAEEDGSGRGHEDASFGAQCSNGASAKALPLGVAQKDTVRQTHRLCFPISTEEGQGTYLRLRILPRSFATSG